MTEKIPRNPDEFTNLLSLLAKEDYCYLTTTGRVSGQPREIEIWFMLQGSTLYMLSGGGDRSNWVKNLRKTPVVSVRIARHTFPGVAREVADAAEDSMARRLLTAKYQGWREGSEMSEWGKTAKPIAVDLQLGQSS